MDTSLKARMAPHLGLLTIARIVENAGHSVEVVNENLGLDTPCDKVDLVGISASVDVLPRANDIKVLHHFPAVWKALEDFGWTEAEWTPYWENPLVVSPEGVKASVYRKGGKRLAVVSNLSPDQSVTAEVKLPTGVKKLELKPFRMELIEF